MDHNRRNDGYIVYIHLFPNGKVYVGQTRQKPQYRWANGKGYKGSYVSRAIEKYGWDNIDHLICAEKLTHDEANKLETLLISFFESNKREHGYNISMGGEHSRAKLHNSPEHNQKISDSHKKRVCCYLRDGTLVGTYESVMLAAECVHGSFRVISACCNGSKKSGYGYVWRFEGDPFDKYETKNKKGGVKGMPVVAHTTSGDFIGVFPSVKAASQATGIREDVIGWICKGMRSEKNNLVFRYYKESDTNEQ